MVMIGSCWQHKKTGGIYEVVIRAVIEATMTPAVVYKSLHDLRHWVRPESEFIDGRFEQVDVTAVSRTETPSR